jgi:hypothetical protein
MAACFLYPEVRVASGVPGTDGDGNLKAEMR